MTIYTSVLFTALSHYAFQRELLGYALLWFFVSCTSVFVHSEYFDRTVALHGVILAADRALCYAIAAYGAYVLFTRVERGAWGVPLLAFGISMYLWHQKLRACDRRLRAKLHLAFHAVCMAGHAYIMHAAV